MRWPIDSDVLIEGERGNPAFVLWLQTKAEFATAEIVRAEYLFGVHAVADATKRARGEMFYRERVFPLAALPNEPGDFEQAARLAGEAWRQTNFRPSLIDGLLAAIALRKNAVVATRNVKGFEAMGCPCRNPLENPTGQAAT